MTTAIIAGGGPSGLYLAWRLLSSGKNTFDSVKVFEMSPDRFGGRIWTKTFSDKGFVDLGGMRFADANTHPIINKVISELNLGATVTNFVETENRLLYLRGKHIYQQDISESQRVPYNDDKYNSVYVDAVFGALSKAIAGTSDRTRQEWCDFLESGKVPNDFDSSIFPPGSTVSNIGYWDLMIDYLGSEAFQYCADAGGYTSNIINWNSADAIQYNGEFAADVKYYRFKGGYSTFIEALASKVQDLGGQMSKDHRLASFDTASDNKIKCSFIDHTGTAYPEEVGDALFLAMPKRSVELIYGSARAGSLAADLGSKEVRLLLESIIEQPSYKIAISFASDWWNKADYVPALSGSAWGPTVTDLPLRQIYYFSPESEAPDTHAVLASYDDMRFTRFWQELEIPLSDRRTEPISLNFQPLGTGQVLTPSMKAMVAKQLAEVHYSQENTSTAAEAIFNGMKEAYLMDWSLDPFGAGYHAWAAHYSACNVMTSIRTPLAATGLNVPVYLCGSAYSNDQAWVEGAFCTAESILIDEFNYTPFIDTTNHPLICKC
ncbi:MAG: FAD-dependent oxidoreductase [Aestuariivita sp.]|nr:FAD-dependent oxidoreductase [Aestuariivita sp.]MCY4202737.1 FAD-dependent oxidoreductase [Aestuariivita sp.]